MAQKPEQTGREILPIPDIPSKGEIEERSRFELPDIERECTFSH